MVEMYIVEKFHVNLNPILSNMNSYDILNVTIRCVFILTGCSYLYHLLMTSRHGLITSLPALATLGAGIVFNCLAIIDVLLKTNPLVAPIGFQINQIGEVLVAFIIGALLLSYLKNPNIHIGNIWKGNLFLVLLLTTVLTILRCILNISTALVILKDNSMLVITHKSSDWVVYMCVFMPQYIILLSLICFANSQNNQVKKKMVHGNCDICKVVNLYYTLNIIYIGIILFIVKPLSLAYCNFPACDKNTEYLIVPPFFAVTCVYLGRSIRMIRHNKSPASDQKIFLV